MGYDAVKEIKGNCYEKMLTLLSGLRKVGELSSEDISYNNALADVFNYILEDKEYYLLPHTIKCGKWIRD